MMISIILLFLGVPIAFKITSTALHISVRDSAKSLLISLSIGLMFSSLISSLLYLVSPSFRWEDLPFLTPILALGNVIFGTYIYAKLFKDRYMDALRGNISIALVTLTIAVFAYVLLLTAGLL